jgi:hypothetical protein
MPDIILTVVSGEPVDLGLSIPGVQGPMGQSTLPSGGTIGQIITKASSANYDASWTSTASGLTLRNSTISGTTVLGSISGGTYLTPTITGATINATTINGGTANSTALSNAIIDACTIDNSTFEDGTIFNITLSGTVANVATVTSGTYNNSTLSSPVVISPTISGNITASGGVIVFASGASMGFFGASPIVCPSGISIPSGGASTAEVLTSLSGVIVALRNLGLIRA